MKATEFNDKKMFSEASGSMAVVDSNIKMKLNKFGLFEETLEDSTLSVSQDTLNVSPNFNTQTNETKIADELYSNIEDIEFDKRLGYYKSLYAGHVIEDNFRNEASSGGMGTWILKELFVRDKVDYIIHVKESKNDELLFKYDISDSIEGIKDGAKTKYYPVEFSDVLRRVKEVPGRYVIIGIPSFIYAIRLLAKEDQVINDRIKYTVGLICGHQKSTKFAESMAWQVGIKPGDLINIDFRHKLLERPASEYGVKMTGLIDEEIKTIIKPTSELYGQNWGWGFFKPTASNYTDDVFNETADIVLGDAWLAEYISDSLGSNVVIVRNQEIDQLITDSIESNQLKMDIINKETIFASQASHYRHTHDELGYRLFVNKKEDEWVPKKRVNANDNFTKTRKKIQSLRKVISNQSHIQYLEAVKIGSYQYFVDEMTKYTAEYTRLYQRMNRKNKIVKLTKLKPRSLFKKIYNKVFK